MSKTVATFKKMMTEGQKIAMLTCYDYSMASIMDKAGIDIFLIGDSLGMTMLGYDSTLPVTMEDMIHHTACVARGAKEAFVLADMPFMSYQVSVEQAVINAGRLVKEGGAHGVKLEGGVKVAKQIEAIVNADIPVCAHIGLTPQSVNAFGGFKVQGKSLEAAKQLIEDAKAVEAAGAFMVVMEGIPSPVAKKITEVLNIPTIGIGAGPDCDGQVLVYQDMLGMFPGHKPKFVKTYANLGEIIDGACKGYMEEMQSGAFPAPENQYSLDPEVAAELEKL